MNMKKILAMMAVATVLSSGVAPGVTAHANDFTNGTNGYQTATKYDDADPTQKPADAEGEIKINGEFKKTVVPNPNPDQPGKYIHVSMPIEMNYIYDTDSNNMQSAAGSVINGSVEAEQDKSGNIITTPQPVLMRFAGVTNTNAQLPNGKKVEFVETVNHADNDKLQLPFEVEISRNGVRATAHSLSEIEKAQANNGPSLEIKADETIQLQLKLITGQTVNKDALSTDLTRTTHGLKMQFEYKGK